MTAESEYAVDLLLQQARVALYELRFPAGEAAARRAVEAAEAIESPTHTIYALVALGEALQGMERNVEAMACFTRVWSKLPEIDVEDADTNWFIGVAYLGWVGSARSVSGVPEHKLLDALDDADRWVARTGATEFRSAILLERARSFSRLGELETAEQFAHEALSAYRSAGGVYGVAVYMNHLADVLRLRRRYQGAKAMYETALQEPDADDIDRINTYSGLTLCALDQGDTDAAARHAGAALRIGQSIGGMTLLDVELLSLRVPRPAGELDEAWEMARRATDHARRVGDVPLLHDAMSRAAAIAADKEDVEALVSLLAELATLAQRIDADIGGHENVDGVADLYARAARVAEKTDAPGWDAEAIFRRAEIELDRPVHLLLLRAWFLVEHRRQMAEAEELYRRAAETWPDSREALSHWAWFLTICVNDPTRAAEFYERALRSDEVAVEDLMDLAYIRADQHELDVAEDLFERALRAEPDNLQCQISHAWFSYRHRGRKDEARLVLERIVDDHPDDPAGIATLADLCASHGEIERAVDLYRRAIELDPRNAGQLADCSETLWILGRFAEAEDAARRALEAAHPGRHHDRIELELSFYRLACGPPETREAALASAFDLLHRGTRSEGWTYTITTRAAHAAGRPDVPALRLLGDVIRGTEDVARLREIDERALAHAPERT